MKTLIFSVVMAVSMGACHFRASKKGNGYPAAGRQHAATGNACPDTGIKNDPPIHTHRCAVKTCSMVSRRTSPGGEENMVKFFREARIE